MGYQDVREALAARPDQFRNVESEVWDRLDSSATSGHFKDLAISALNNGLAFLYSQDGLRGRKPARIEWEGAHRPPRYDLIPAGIRVDHVYLISCKYQSKILFNPSPVHLFTHALRSRTGGQRTDWYVTVALDEYQSLYEAVTSGFRLSAMPRKVTELTRGDPLG